MSKELTVDGKKYLPSTVLAGQFSYTSDYLGKLAREEKVAATRVGRTWYISEESLKNFVASTSEAKARRSQELRAERQAERKEFSKAQNGAVSKSKNNSETVSVPSPFDQISLGSSLEALLQSVAVVACGLLVGSLGFIAHQNETEFGVFATGVNTIVDEMVSLSEPVIMTFNNPHSQTAAVDFSAWWDWLFNKTEIAIEEKVISESQGDQAQVLTQRVQEDQKGLVLLPADTATASVREIEVSFSDEVEVDFDAPNSGLIKPVFKDRSDESYRFLLVPVTEAASE